LFHCKIYKAKARNYIQKACFIAGLLTAWEGDPLQLAAQSAWSHLRYRSEAFNLSLLLENAVLRRNVLHAQPMA